MFLLVKVIFNNRDKYYLIIFIFLLFYSSSVFSAVPYCAAHNVAVSFGDISVRNDVSIGESFGEKVVVKSRIMCRHWHEMRMFVDSVAGAEYENRVFNTTIPGVGIRWETENENKVKQLMALGGVRGLSTKVTYKNTFSLIKTGDHVSGQSGNILINMKYKQYENIGGNLYSYNISAFSVREASCEVLTPRVNVPMGTILKSHFRGKNSTIGEQVFNIAVKCKGPAQASITWQGGDTNGVINADATSTAKGVDIQLWDGDHPLEFYKEITLGHIAGEIRLPYTAKYYQTSDRVSIGSVNATATFTINYK
ncbi:fimbrial protein [Yersinia ruckeri]|uniref:fimbrial protein n=1 Tax=Yersinia ruckeri TaxID=29486 RepID=UPI0022381A57|nr:fimbrial protein [Yersinia ruckeri]MCW6567184.1 type 1 fimbrial protein [Yersinia ruckeri]